jgi:hypothetical protein
MGSKNYRVRNKITIVDNFLPQKEFEESRDYILSVYQNWFWHDNISTPIDVGIRNYGFGFNLTTDTNKFRECETKKYTQNLIESVRDFARCKNILRARLDMTTNVMERIRHCPHVDRFDRHVSAIFYFTDSDAETVIYNEKLLKPNDTMGELTVNTSVRPKENRLMLFDGQHIHTGHSPVKYSRRVLLNINLN